VRRRAQLWIGALGLLAAAGSFALVATSSQLVRPLAYGFEIALVVLGAVGVGLYWAIRRPGNLLLCALLGTALAAVGVSLQGASQPVLHSIGVLFDPVIFALGYYLVFAYPEGRLAGAASKLLFGGIVVVILISFVPWFFFSPVVAGGAPLASCNALCPANGLMIADRPGLASGFGRTEQLLAVALAIAIVGYLIARVLAASRPRRRALLPVYVPALFLTIPFALFQATGADLIQLNTLAVDRIGWFLTVGRTILALSLGLAVVQSSYFAGDALKAIVSELNRAPTASQLRAIVAEALDDPGLELAFEVDPERSLFVASRGEPITPDSTPPGRTATPIVRKGRTVAFVLHDPALNTDPELVSSAGQAVLLVLENNHLETDLRAARARLVAAADDARREIERDLHDGAQQGLVSVLVRLRLAREAAREDPGLVRHLDGLVDQLEEVLDDLRQLGHGIYPALLRDVGLPRALAAVAGRAIPPAQLDLEAVGRYRSEIEEAVYLCCLEALQNVGKHAGGGVEARIVIRERPDRLEFEIRDEGQGFRHMVGAAEGQGLTNMQERLAAVRGTLEVESAPGGGTRVRGGVPLGSDGRRPAGGGVELESDSSSVVGTR
jgi:signal transduction histidine kinase